MTETVLQEAARIIDGQRTDDYGNPEDSFQLIADYWNTYLSEVLDVTDTKLGPADVAHMMALLKLARVTTGHSTRDSYVDLAGYAALAARTQGLDEVPVESLPHGEPDPDVCHCGEPVYIHDGQDSDDWTRGLCRECDEVRCDLDPANCGKYRKSDFAKSGTSRIPEHVHVVVVAGRRYIRSVEYDGLWVIAGLGKGAVHWTEGDIYQYATEQNAEVEYL